MKKMKLLLLIITFCTSILAYAQQDAWIYLTDKENVAASVANPITILTQKAIDRKAAHGVTIDDRDVPVNENYITQLKTQTGISVLAKSKWFNAVHVCGTETDINALSNLAFVSSITFADNSLNAKTVTQGITQNKFIVENNIQTTFNYGSATNQIEMFNGHQLHLGGYTGTGITVAVIDAGFPNVNTMAGFQRLRDAGNLLGGYDFFDRTSDVYANTTSSHGTLVLSDMAGFVQDQFVGTAPDASYYLFRTENAPNENPIEESLWVEAAERADSLGVDIINTSLGYKTYDNPNYSHSSQDINGNTTYITKGANIAFEKGMLLINSAGNSGASGLNAPADAAGVLTIGAVQADGTYAGFSSQGSAIQPTQKPDIVVQGAASAVINQNDVVTTSNGTSFSSPIIAGGIVCLWQALPNLNNAEIMQLVRESASQYASPDYFLGYGIPDLAMALNQGLSVEELETNTTLNIYPNPVQNELTIEIPSVYESVQVQLYNILGKKVLETTVTNTESKINVSVFANGIYLLKIDTNDLSKTIKLIIN